MWDVHNEPSLPGCWCENTLAAYRKAVESEYGGVDGYNRAFGTTFASPKDLLPPRDRSTYADAWRHWRHFIISELNLYLNEARDTVKRYAPDSPVTYNPTDPFSPMHHGQDWWNLHSYDAMSCSLYWGSGEDKRGKEQAQEAA